MSLQVKIADDLMEAMRRKDSARVSALRMIKAGIKYAEVAKGASLDDPGVVEVLSKQARERRESIVEFNKGGRQDLVAKEEAELQILLEYMPQQLSREEITAEAQRVVQETGAKGPQDKGKVMQALMGKLRGRAEGREINEVVTHLLTSDSTTDNP
ncbi:MAG: hypothetical protein HW403_266 [Dehalococcoidia bacterium]|nr:hypothetical protein [Dehalococcoidia bacterium]